MKKYKFLIVLVFGFFWSTNNVFGHSQKPSGVVVSEKVAKTACDKRPVFQEKRKKIIEQITTLRSEKERILAAINKYKKGQSFVNSEKISGTVSKLETKFEKISNLHIEMVKSLVEIDESICEDVGNARIQNKKIKNLQESLKLETKSLNQYIKTDLKNSL